MDPSILGLKGQGFLIRFLHYSTNTGDMPVAVLVAVFVSVVTVVAFIYCRS